MAAIKELIRAEEDGRLSFGDYELQEKKKLDNFEFAGDLYKIKTFKEITKLERNGMFVYESVEGTAVEGFKSAEDGVEFTVEGPADAQIILGLEDATEYHVSLNGTDIGTMKTNLGGKLALSVELGNAPVQVKVVRA